MLKKISLKHIFLFLLCLIFTGLIVHYCHLKQIQKTNFTAELNKYYHVETFVRPEIEKQFSEIDSRTIVTFGSSSFIVPGTCDASYVFPGTFPALLGDYLKKDKIKVLNLSVCGDDTKTELGTLRSLFKHKKPLAIIFYTGQSDYTNVFRELLQKKYDLVDSDLFYNKILAFLPIGITFQIDHFLKNNFESAMIKLYRSFDPELFNKSSYHQMAALINNHVEDTVSKMIQEAGMHDSKIVFITPMANVLYRPVGADQDLMDFYNKAMESRNVNALWKVSDLDFFGFDQRVKTDTIAMFKKHSSPHVLVIDLFERPETKSVAFYEENFVDIFHFNGAGHRWIFNTALNNGLMDFLKRH